MTDSQLSQPTKRARQAGQKQERRQLILEAAWAIFQRSSYEAVTMEAVARETSLAKGTLFLYFRTKEELFLAVTAEQITAWFSRVDQHLAEMAEPAPLTSVAQILADSVSQQAGFARLMAILSTGLEQNVSFAASLAFKENLLTQMARTGNALERCLAFLQPGEGAHLLMQCQALLVGFWHLADPAPVICEVLKRPEMQVFKVDFEQEFHQALLALLKGLEQGSR